MFPMDDEVFSTSDGLDDLSPKTHGPFGTPGAQTTTKKPQQISAHF